MDGPHGPKGSLVSDGHGDPPRPSAPRISAKVLVPLPLRPLLLPALAPRLSLLGLSSSAPFVLSPFPSDPCLAACFQGPQGEPGPPGQQGTPGTQVSGPVCPPNLRGSPCAPTVGQTLPGDWK